MKTLTTHECGPYRVRIRYYRANPEAHPADRDPDDIYLVETCCGYSADGDTWAVVSEHSTERAARSRFNLVVRVVTGLALPKHRQFINPEVEAEIQRRAESYTAKRRRAAFRLVK